MTTHSIRLPAASSGTCPATGQYSASVEQTSRATGCDVTYKLALTGGPATSAPTASPTVTPTPTGTRTATPTRRSLYLPLMVR